MIALDTETTGLDLHHGCKPFLVTICDEKGNNTWWEWDVDPLTREPIVVYDDLIEIQQVIDEADAIVLQNAKFDYTALQLAFCGRLKWDWGKVHDTLMAGHLLASNHRHDLASMCLEYLDLDIQPYDDRMRECIQEARKWAKVNRTGKIVQDITGKKVKTPEWRLAKKGLPEMPSAREKVWKADCWLPRAVVKEVGVHTVGCKVVHKNQPHDVYIGRGTKWGNPFRLGKDGTRLEVIGKYRKWIQTQPKLLDSLSELEGKTLGCHCKPRACHGDVLVELVAELLHPWLTVCSDYANADSASTMALWLQQRKLLMSEGLWRIYQERPKLIPILGKMEDRGVTINRNRLEERRAEYTEESRSMGRRCVNIAKSYDYELELPKSGNNKSLRTFVFGEELLVCSSPMGLASATPCTYKRVNSDLENLCDGDLCPQCGEELRGIVRPSLGLKPLKRSDKTGEPSLDKATLDHWCDTLPKRGKPLAFVRALMAKRKRDTAINYLEGYERFWLPLDESQTWYILHPSLNPTGSDTLRFSSSNPNEQNISKQEGFNLRRCFGPAPGREWWSLDFENLELRIPAYEAGETDLVYVFDHPEEPPYYGSYHLVTADLLYPDLFEKWGKEFKGKYKTTLYQWLKNGNFAVIYGAQEETADKTYHVPGAFRKIQHRFPRIAELARKQIALAEQRGYVETIPDRSINSERGYPLYCSRSRWGGVSPTIPLNYHVQGTAMWLTMMAMIRVQKYLDELNAKEGSKGYYMIMQVHDEIVLDFPAKKPGTVGGNSNLAKIKRIQRIMERGGRGIGVPTTVSVEYHPDNWGEGVSV